MLWTDDIHTVRGSSIVMRSCANSWVATGQSFYHFYQLLVFLYCKLSVLILID